MRDIDGFALSPASLKMLAAIDPTSLPRVEGNPRIGPCVVRPVNYVCIGLNYADHAAEAGMPVPKEPIIFLKSLGAFSGPNDDVLRPRESKKLDWECRAWHRDRDDRALCQRSSTRWITSRVIAFVTMCPSASFRLERSGTWDKGKGADTFGPTGPWMVTKDEVPDPQNLALWTEVNGKKMQNGSTQDDDFRSAATGELCQPLHYAARGRRDRHRHAARGGAGDEAGTGILAAGRRDAIGRRGSGNSNAAGIAGVIRYSTMATRLSRLPAGVNCRACHTPAGS